MPVLNWTTSFIDGKEWLIIDLAKLRIPLEWDPESTVFLAVAAPDGGILNHPALVQGDDGATPDIDTVINFEAIAYGSPTAPYASFTEVAPNVYQLNLGLPTGEPGADGVMVLTPSDYGTPAPYRMLQLKADLTGFELAAQRVGNRYIPAVIANAPTGNAAYTLCNVPIPAQPFDWYPEVEGQCVITGTGADLNADVVARLSTTGIVNGETTGPEIGRGFGGTLGVNAAGLATVLSSAPPAGSSATYDKVLAGNAATVYFRVERQAGSNTFTTSADTSRFKVRVEPIPAGS